MDLPQKWEHPSHGDQGEILLCNAHDVSVFHNYERDERRVE